MTRFRTMYDISTSIPYQNFGWDTSSADTYTNSTYVPLLKHVWMEDVVTPNWKKLMASGKIVNNPMTRVELICNQKLYEHHRVGKYNNTNIYSADWRGLIALPTGYPWAKLTPTSVSLLLDEAYQDARNIAISKAWADVQLSEIQALASLGEMPETVKWISSLMGRAVSLLRAIRAKNVKNLVKYQISSKKESIDTVSNLWLEIRYALRPLVFEMQQAITAMQTQIQKGMRQTARGFNREQIVSTTYETRTLGACYVDVRTTTVRRSNYRAGVLYAIDSDINGILSVWGIDQPLETIWELTPLSFIFDWFFNVGEVLSSWTGNAGLHPLTSFVTEHHEFICRADVTGYVFRPASTGYTWYTQEVKEAGWSQQNVTIKRRLSNPSRSFLPTCKIKLDLAKITDLAFIGRSLINGFTDKSRRNLRL